MRVLPAKHRQPLPPPADATARSFGLVAARTARALRLITVAAIALACWAAVSAANGQETTPSFSPQTISQSITTGPESWASPEQFDSTLKVVLTLTVMSLAPAILLMTTSYIRIAVVLGLLRQALGIQQLPSNQVISSIALFMTLLIMSPVWKDVYDEAIAPYTDPSVEMSAEEAWQAGIRPVRRFMSRQIKLAGNHDDVWLFYQRLPADTPTPENYDDVPLQVLLPAFMLSELKVAFLIGFQVYLPFLILDLVVSSVTISMGMLMLPPMMISMPLKLMLFVLVDGWHLVVGMLLDSFAPYL
ncbi:MAG: flagellar type III secretion system pore protein FliP [Planctomycetes bacterium]|nr:flagellar type III secretion system pore protein FliP [Planctomycetota bacterium]MBL7042777.1 flagellar type III secretion system pore protein FliP [Pirellulaceae bacterium]